MFSTAFLGFTRPFISRSLRGQRSRRVLSASLIGVLFSVFFGVWFALGSGELEQELRIEADLEEREWRREASEFVVLTHSEQEHELAETAQRGLISGIEAGHISVTGPGWSSELLTRYAAGLETLVGASKASTHRGGREQQMRAVELLELLKPPQENPVGEGDNFSFASAEDRDRLEQILAAGGVPHVRPYASELDNTSALRIVGFVSAVFASLLLLVLAPVLVAVQQAEEVNANTLAPLTATSLRPRQLVLGLASGPWVIVGMLVLPQVLLFLLMAALTGSVFYGVGGVIVMVASSAVLTVLAQLVGHMTGRRRTPGMVGIGLLGLTGMLWWAGAILACNVDSVDVSRFLSVLPGGAALHLMGRALGSGTEHVAAAARGDLFALRVVPAAIVFAWLGVEALRRRLAATTCPSLTTWEAGLGALVATLTVSLAIPVQDYHGDPVIYVASIVVLAIPYAALLAARVPVGDDPPRLRSINLPRLLGELAVVGLFHFSVVCMIDGDTVSGVLQGGSLLYIGWAYLVLGLLAVRAVAVPSKLGGTMWNLFCGVCLVVGFTNGATFASDTHHSATDWLMLSELSPVLGLMQVVCLIVVPWSLARSLRRQLGSVTGEQAPAARAESA